MAECTRPGVGDEAAPGYIGRAAVRLYYPSSFGAATILELGIRVASSCKAALLTIA